MHRLYLEFKSKITYVEITLFKKKELNIKQQKCKCLFEQNISSRSRMISSPTDEYLYLIANANLHK